MNRTVCCFKLIELLESEPGQVFTAQHIADLLHTRKRCIGDYVIDLRDANIPIQTKRGREGGYFIAPEDIRRPLYLSLADLQKLTTLYNLLESKEKIPAIQKALRPLDYIIQHCARGMELSQSTTQYLLHSENSPLDENEKIYLNRIDQAITNHQTIEFAYQSVANSDVDPQSIPPRKTDPYTLVYDKGDRPYFIGYDHKHEDYRVFRISSKRILWISGYMETYQPDPDYSPQKILGTNGLVRGESVRYTIRVKETGARFFLEKGFGQDVKQEKCDQSGWRQYSFTSDNPHEVFDNLYRMQDSILLLGPQQAREQYLKGLKDILESYSQNTDSYQ